MSVLPAIRVSETQENILEHKGTKAAARTKVFRPALEPFLYLLPAALVFAGFVFYPFFKTFYISLFLTNPEGEIGRFVGLKNYAALFTSPEYLNSILVTLKFVVLTVPAELVIGFVLAVLANVKLKGIAVFRTLYALPIAISSASAAVIWMLLFNPGSGWINYGLSLLGIHGIGWLTDSRWGLIAVSIVNVWLSIGVNFIFLLAGLQGIDRELYESARIDGANALQQHAKITLPLLSPTLFFVAVIDGINAFQEFGVINIMTQGGPVNTTNVMVYSIYRDAFFNFRIGMAAAESIILFALLAIGTWLQFRVGERKVLYQ